MKSLIYIPIIHEDVDLGSLAAAARKKGLEICGNAVWERHKETVRLFWKRIEQFLKSIDANDLEIFQDGLPAEGHMGLKIIQEGAKRGSRNHQIVLDLIHRGATLKKTEDIEPPQRGTGEEQTPFRGWRTTERPGPGRGPGHWQKPDGET